MLRPATRRTAVPVALTVALLAGCGTPPEPLPTSPPQARGSVSAGPSGMPLPSAGPPTGGVPGVPPGGLPTGGFPPGVFPTGGLPVYPTYTRPPTPSTSPTRSLPPAAPACGSSPTRQQMLDLLKDNPGLPAGKRIEVRQGPYCQGSWQLAILGIVGESAGEAEPLLMVSTGRPAALRLISAGGDVCTDQVEDDAPAGIRVRACGF